VESLPLLIMVLLAFVLLIVLPSRQRKKLQANQQAMQNALTTGTPVMLTSGIHGTVAGLGEGTVDVEVSPGVVLTVARQAILEIRKPAVDTAAPEATSGPTGTVDGNGDPIDPTR
jgi:preprotein translocase subunit YajC